MMRRISLLRGLWIAAIASVTFVAHATDLRTYQVTDDPDDNVVTHIEASFAHHAEAASAWYLDNVRGHAVTRDQFDVFARRYMTGTFAEFQYIYHRDGVEHTRVYHGASGRGEPPLGVDGRRPSRRLRSYADAEDFAVLADVVRVEGSDVTPSPADDGRGPSAHDYDAELRIAQTLENDIQQGIVARGGRLVGFVSQPMCVSCRAAIERLTYAYELTTSVTSLQHGGRAYRRFHGRRRAYLQAVLGHAQGNAAHTGTTTTPSTVTTDACGIPVRQ